MTFEEFVELHQYAYRQEDGKYTKGNTFSYNLPQFDQYTYQNKGKTALNKKDNPVIFWIENCSGAEGGNWRGGKPKGYTHNIGFNYKELKDFLRVYYPNLTLTKYWEIEKLIQTDEYTEYEYYGNYSDYIIKYIELKKLYELLESEDD